MAEPEIILTEIDPTENPHATLTFENEGHEASVKVTLEFDGEWLDFFEDAPSEEEARHGFAGELFGVITRLF